MIVIYANIFIGFPTLWIFTTSVSSIFFSKESSRQDSLKLRSSASKILPEGDSICSHFLLFFTLSGNEHRFLLWFGSLSQLCSLQTILILAEDLLCHSMITGWSLPRNWEWQLVPKHKWQKSALMKKLSKLEICHHPLLLQLLPLISFCVHGSV